MSKKNKNKNKAQAHQTRPQPQHHRPTPPPPPQQPRSAQPAPRRSISRSLEQERAADALRKIRELSGDAPGYYVSYVSALPATIVMNGLGQALVMLLAKAKGDLNKEHRILYGHLASWLSKQVDGLNGNDDDVVKRLMEGDQALYVRAQTEAMAYLHWLKQFARAYLREREGQEN